jgi:putative Mn2+ efflux pump MntP
MNLYDVILIAVALSMDAGAITISNCTVYKNSLSPKKQWSMPVFFAIFQAVMPLIGFALGSLATFIRGDFASYLSSAIFFILSSKIFIDIIKDAKEKTMTFSETKEEREKDKKVQNLTFLVLILQGIATSIDALVIGITFVELTFSIWLAVLVIAVITFIIVGLCVLFGKKLGHLLGRYADFVGAIILLILAIKSLVQIFI